MLACAKNGTWSLVPSPPNVNLVGNKWVFKVKRHPDGSVEQCKAHLVVKGFINYQGLTFMRPSVLLQRLLQFELYLHGLFLEVGMFDNLI